MQGYSLLIHRAIYRRKTDAHYTQPHREADTLIYYLSGGHEFTFNDSSILVTQGQLLYLPKGIAYKNRRLEANTKYYQLEFDFSFEKEISAFTKPIALSKNDSEIFLPLLRDSYNAFSTQNQADLLLCNANIFKALSLLKSICDKKESSVPADKIAPTITYLEEHYTENTDISQLALFSDMSVSSLEKHFIKSFGCSPITYRNKIRLRHAKLLLASGFSVSEAAYRVGFSDVFYFSRIFKKLEGITPSNFSKQNKGL